MENKNNIKYFIVNVICLLIPIIIMIFVGIKYKCNPLDYFNNPVQTMYIHESRDVADYHTGLTSKANKTMPNKDYQATLNSLGKTDVDSQTLQKLIKTNSTFFLHVNSNNDQLNNMLSQCDKQAKVKVLNISAKDMQNYNNESRIPILISEGSVAYIKNGLVTSQFESNYSKNLNNVKNSYLNWLNQMKGK